MSFIENNQNFIHIKFNVEMRDMSIKERVVHYNKNLKNETLKRLIDYFQLPKIEINSNLVDSLDLFTEKNIEVNRLIKDYTEVFKLLKDYEFETILNSIYFEKNADELFYNLRTIIIDSIPHNYNNENLILNILNVDKPNQDCLKLTAFLQSIFINKLGLSPNDWNNENRTTHNVSNKLCYWVNSKLKELNTEKEISFILFHFTKYWNVYFYTLTDDIKRIVILNRLSDLLEKNGIEHVTNINRTFILIKNQLGNVFCEFSMLPFFLTTETPFLSNGLINQLKRFEKAMNVINLCFEDLSEEKFIDLIIKYIESDLEIRKILYIAIFNKIEEGLLPSKLEISDIGKLIKKDNNEELLKNDMFLNHFLKRNYLFSLMNVP